MKNNLCSWQNVPRHIYMKGENGQGIFYNTEDCLYFLTLFSVLVRRYSVRTLGFCIMFNHVHALLRFPNKETQITFLTRLTQSFVHGYNVEYGRTGALFLHSYGHAPKETAKTVRSCIAYIGNNPVAGRLTRRAQDYRWNLCAYADSTYPFSASVSMKTAANPLRRAFRYVDTLYRMEQPLSYGAQRVIFNKLSTEGRKSIIDRIVTRYNFLDYSAWERLFGSKSKALYAMEANTGTEYDLPEDWEDYSMYRRMLQIAREYQFLSAGHGVDSLTDNEKLKLWKLISNHLTPKERQIRKFLHLFD